MRARYSAFRLAQDFLQTTVKMKKQLAHNYENTIISVACKPLSRLASPE